VIGGGLCFLARKTPIFYRWDRFEQAIKDADDEELVKSLKVLRGIVKGQLKAAFTVSKDMIDHGVITPEYLWTLFKPGDLVYNVDIDGNDQIFHIRSVQALPWNFQLSCQYVDWNGKVFGFVESSIEVRGFSGTKSIRDLNVYPIQHHADVEGLKAKLKARGERFRDLTGIHYKSYKEHGDRNGMTSLTRQVRNFYHIFLRSILTRRQGRPPHHHRCRVSSRCFKENSQLPLR
jgi:hypothetical protein